MKIEINNNLIKDLFTESKPYYMIAWHQFLYGNQDVSAKSSAVSVSKWTHVLAI